jgi:hypothetical protein
MQSSHNGESWQSQGSHKTLGRLRIFMASLFGRVSSRGGGGSARLSDLLVVFLLSALTVITAAPLEAAHAQASASSVTVASVDQNGNAIPHDYYAVFQAAAYGPDRLVASGVTTSTFAATAGSSYELQVYAYGACTFSSWSNGATSDPMPFTATSGALSFTAVYDCSGSTSGGGGVGGGGGGTAGTITIYDHRVPQSNWASCFATVCSAGTGPGASMWVVLYDSAGKMVATGFANENGHVFTGLNPSATYYVYPADCDSCHSSTHDVLFSHWGDESTTRPLAVIAANTSVDAWYVCTNTCGGV